MDTTTFILERDVIQRRMEIRRVESTTGEYALKPRILPWALKAGVGLVSGIRATRGSYGWMGSVAGALLLPVLLRFTGHKKGSEETIWHKLARAAFPSLRF